MTNSNKTTVTFLGVGSASQIDLGHASIVIEIEGKRLLVDCGPGTTKRFLEKYHRLPDAVFVTHCHLDHVADFENLFIRAWFHPEKRRRPKVFVPAKIISILHERVGNYPGVLAEGGVNFWEAFHLIPVKDNFIFMDKEFHVIPVRHHKPETAYGLRLPEKFFYSGDTRPIPEVLQHQLNESEVIFHDCSVVGNPSHTGIDDIKREYSDALIERIHCYHYVSSNDEKDFIAAGLKTIKQGQVFEFL